MTYLFSIEWNYRFYKMIYAEDNTKVYKKEPVNTKEVTTESCATGRVAGRMQVAEEDVVESKTDEYATQTEDACSHKDFKKADAHEETPTNDYNRAFFMEHNWNLAKHKKKRVDFYQAKRAILEANESVKRLST
jgi:thioesterase domain-containing protein